MSQQLLEQLCMTFDTMGTGTNDTRKQAEDYLKHVSFLMYSTTLLDSNIGGNRLESPLHGDSR